MSPSSSGLSEIQWMSGTPSENLRTTCSWYGLKRKERSSPRAATLRASSSNLCPPPTNRKTRRSSLRSRSAAASSVEKIGGAPEVARVTDDEAVAEAPLQAQPVGLRGE